MDLQSKHKPDAAFNMASMTDIVFLLLIFFMLTASFITPSGLPVNLPSAAGANIVMQKNSITITADMRYYLNDREVSMNTLERELRSLVGNEEGALSVHVDETVDTGYSLQVAGIAAKLKQKTTFVVKAK